MFSFFKKKSPQPDQLPVASAPAPTASAPAPSAPTPERTSWLGRLKAGLRKTGASIATVFTGTRIDDALYEDLEGALLMADAVDVKNVNLGKVANNGQLAVKDGKTVHRVAMQLCYVDPVTQATVKVNPYVDFTLAANGVGVPVKDAQGAFTDAKKVADRASCNECHSNFAQHGGNRVDPNYCVVCHNTGSTDYNTGNPIDLKLMVHKFHMGKRLTNDYQVVGAIAKKTVTTKVNDIDVTTITGVVYPQNQKNCVACHDGSATAKHKTAQGDNWKSTASKNACLRGSSVCRITIRRKPVRKARGPEWQACWRRSAESLRCGPWWRGSMIWSNPIRRARRS